uniref:Uncharacterized protein MANES_06G092600 n=2 Tax=Rhizophora mucronata TaxID=61149 RepID=A0A2P2KC56_RHIMU
MGRPPCCDKIGVRKGPWNPEEDIILVSYIQKHGAGNWRSVPPNTGLLRCSKSCRLRWTNYLRPGIKRGNFTDHEEKMIIHLQELMGNRWSAIASYLPERTDNDIKNYWNTHLKKKLKKHQGSQNTDGISGSQPKGQWERRLQTDIRLAKQALCEALSLNKPSRLSNSKPSSADTFDETDNRLHQSQTSVYASSAENIAKLLENWMKSPPKPAAAQRNSDTAQTSFNNTAAAAHSSSSEGAQSVATPEGFDSLFSFNSSNSDASQSADDNANITAETSLFQDEGKPIPGTQFPLTSLEKWLLFDEGAAQGQEDPVNMSIVDCSGLF